MYRHVPVFPPAAHVHFPDREIGYMADVRRAAAVARRYQYHQPQPGIGARSAQGPLRAPATTTQGESHVNKIRISKRHRPASGPLEPLPADPRDRDIVRAKQLAVRSRPPGATPRARDAEPGQGFACAEDRHA